VSRTRGVRLQLALARYLSAWWPSAESAGSGRNGSDVLGTPGIVWECKTAREFRPAEWCRQARRHMASFGVNRPVDVPVTVYLPDGLGEAGMGAAIAMMPLADMIGLLGEAGYVPAKTGAET
jgi:hypothetical protein